MGLVNSAGCRRQHVSPHGRLAMHANAKIHCHQCWSWHVQQVVCCVLYHLIRLSAPACNSMQAGKMRMLMPVWAHTQAAL